MIISGETSNRLNGSCRANDEHPSTTIILPSFGCDERKTQRNRPATPDRAMGSTPRLTAKPARRGTVTDFEPASRAVTTGPLTLCA